MKAHNDGSKWMLRDAYNFDIISLEVFFVPFARKEAVVLRKSLSRPNCPKSAPYYKARDNFLLAGSFQSRDKENMSSNEFEARL